MVSSFDGCTIAASQSEAKLKSINMKSRLRKSFEIQAIMKWELEPFTNYTTGTNTYDYEVYDFNVSQIFNTSNIELKKNTSSLEEGLLNYIGLSVGEFQENLESIGTATSVLTIDVKDGLS